MKSIFFILLFQFAFLYPVLSQNSCYELVWNDEFNYSGLPDSTKWSAEVGGNGWGNNELQYYTRNRLENARVENGELIIEARKEEYQGSDYTSARLITYQNNHSWQYGKIEARMKLPYGQGIWPAFWMLGDKFFEGTGWPGCGEIDIMEMVGGSGRENTVHGTIHWADANNNHASYGGSKTLSDGNFSDDYHVFSIEWDENSIRWYVDGEQFHEVDITPASLSEFRDEFFIIINLAVGGNWPGYPNSSTIFPQKLHIDYVRVYQLNEEPKIIGNENVVSAEQDLVFSTVESEEFNYQWTVPEGAEIVSGQGTHKLNVDWGCESDTIFCVVETMCDTHKLYYPVNLSEIELQGKENVGQGEKVVYFLPLMANTSYSWSYSFDELQTFPDTNFIEISWGIEGGIIKVIYENSCGKDSILKDVSLIRQLPYPNENNPHAIPGIIESVNYDTGGEGISYHDSDTENRGNGPRQDQGVDTETYSGKHNIAYVQEGEWVEYSIKVDTDTTCTMQALVASQLANGEFKIYVNGEERSGIIQVPNTSSWSSFTTIEIEDISFYTSDSILRVYIVGGEFNLRQMNFISHTSTSSREIEYVNKIKIYPSPVSNILYVHGAEKNSSYKILSLDGKLIQRGYLTGESINVSDLYVGVYFLLINGEKNIQKYKFLKF